MSYPQLDSKRRALITGSSRGIGFGIAKRLWSDGWAVTLNGRGRKALEEAHDKLPGSFMAPFDVTVHHEAKQLATEAACFMDGIDLIVCNVGSGKSSAPGQETLTDWQESFAMNFWATVNLVDVAKPYLVKSGGTLICISSICGNEVIPGAPVTYSTAKAALNAYIKNMSRPLADVGIRIMGIAPGNIIFDGSSWDEKKTSNPNAVAKMLKTHVPMERFGRVDEISSIVAFLASEECQFATGTIWTVDGGQTLG